MKIQYMVNFFLYYVNDLYKSSQYKLMKKINSLNKTDYRAKQKTGGFPPAYYLLLYVR